MPFPSVNTTILSDDRCWPRIWTVVPTRPCVGDTESIPIRVWSHSRVEVAIEKVQPTAHGQPTPHTTPVTTPVASGTDRCGGNGRVEAGNSRRTGGAEPKVNNEIIVATKPVTNDAISALYAPAGHRRPWLGDIRKRWASRVVRPEGCGYSIDFKEVMGDGFANRDGAKMGTQAGVGFARLAGVLGRGVERRLRRWFLGWCSAGRRLLLACSPLFLVRAAGGVGETCGTFLVPTRTGEHEARRGHRRAKRSGAPRLGGVDRISRGSCYTSIEKSRLSRRRASATGMEARRAETSDVVLAAPFTRARPPKGGRQKIIGKGLDSRFFVCSSRRMEQNFKVVQVEAGRHE